MSIIILNEDIGKPNQAEDKLKNVIDFNDKSLYTLEQFSQLFSGEFRGLICYYKERNKEEYIPSATASPWVR